MHERTVAVGVSRCQPCAVWATPHQRSHPPRAPDKLRCSMMGCLHPCKLARQSTHTHSLSAGRGFRVNEHETEHLIYSQPGEYVVGRSRPPTPRPRSPAGHSLSQPVSPEQPR